MSSSKRDGENKLKNFASEVFRLAAWRRRALFSEPNSSSKEKPHWLPFFGSLFWASKKVNKTS